MKVERCLTSIFFSLVYQFTYLTVGLCQRHKVICLLLRRHLERSISRLFAEGLKNVNLMFNLSHKVYKMQRTVNRCRKSKE